MAVLVHRNVQINKENIHKYHWIRLVDACLHRIREQSILFGCFNFFINYFRLECFGVARFFSFSLAMLIMWQKTRIVLPPVSPFSRKNLPFCVSDFVVVCVLASMFQYQMKCKWKRRRKEQQQQSTWYKILKHETNKQPCVSECILGMERQKKRRN